MLSSVLFTSPWLLGFLVALPAIWWLLRLTPPAPKRVLFPALALLKGLVRREETPAHSPWWLLLLRLAIAVLLIFALAEPQIDPLPAAEAKGTLLVAIDNDWAAARDWAERQAMLRAILQKARHEHRQVALLATTINAQGETLNILGPMAAEQALNNSSHLTPAAWPADWKQATTLLQKMDDKNIDETIWIAGGLGSAYAKTFYDALNQIAPARVYETDAPIYTLTPPSVTDDNLSVTVMRAHTDKAGTVNVNAIDVSGNMVAHWPAVFSEGSPRALVPLTLPSELRNEIAQFTIDSPRTAASTALLDASWEHHKVGVTGDDAELDRRSLLSEIYYIDRALKPYADLRIAALDQLLEEKLPVIFITDTAEISEELQPKIKDWLEHGGVLVRFAGERFAGAEDHAREAEFLPVPLRHGGRSFGGTLSWDTPQKLKAFPANSPFRNLAIPPDTTISRQILAEPSPELAGKTWAALEDGTPLVTASAMGHGVSILFHIPARTSWSNLPLSGLFVGMLQKIIQMSHNPHDKGSFTESKLQPLSVLDAMGDAHSPAATIAPIPSDDIGNILVSPEHPPGLYGSDSDSMALNLGTTIGQPEALASVPTETYKAEHHGVELQPYLLLAAFLLLLFDFVISLRMRGFARFAFLLIGFLSCAYPARAANDDTVVAELTAKPYLGYIHTGDARVDHVSELGLRGLAMVLQRRTSLDEVGVAEVNPDTDDLTVFPVLYWPVTASEPPLSIEGSKRVTHYIRHGGMILFDAASDEESPQIFLHRVLAGVDIPPLARLPEKHVLKRSFYLLDSFPGRFAKEDFWLETEDTSAYDGVASILFGSNGWAEAWAVDANGKFLFPCTPEGDEQREYAYRFGVNLVIYALTGNYKNGQSNAIKILKEMGE